MTTFALITEGLTDQIVIENILIGYFNNNDIIFTSLQPTRYKDDENKSGYGGWKLVFDYFENKLDEFKRAFQLNDYIIISIDTDVLEEKGFDISKRDENGNDLTPDELIEKVKQKFITLIGDDFYHKYSEKIIFAIAVNSTECWLLPLYYRDKRKSKIVNCLGTLNQETKTKEQFTIDKNNKNPDYYRTISKKYCKHKTFMKSYQNNPSLKVFIEEIESRNIVIEEEEDW